MIDVGQQRPWGGPVSGRDRPMRCLRDRCYAEIADGEAWCPWCLEGLRNGSG